jgi:glycosyltransferase involved in cell wall biosynthesis
MYPTLTIAIPVFERFPGFEEALASALAVEDCVEILVVDDCSNHRQFEEACSANSDTRIRYVRNEENLGLFGNWNECARLAVGDFVAILCSDDVVEPNIYAWFKQAITRCPELDVFFGAFAVFSTTTSDAKVRKGYPTGPISSMKLLEDAAIRGANFPVLSVIRKTKLLQYPFVAKPHSGNDWLWIYTNATAFTLHAEARPLSFWRRHQNQDSKTSQAITTDCWPLMYLEIAKQLRQGNNSDKARLANKRAIGVILSWLLNDKYGTGYHKRLLGPEAKENIFLLTALKIADQNWLLSALLRQSKLTPVYQVVGRLYRKYNIYPL